MKNLFTLLLLVLFTSINAQEDSIKISNTERLIDKYSGKVIN